MAEGKFVISAQNRIKEGLDAAQKDLSSFGGAAESIAKKIEGAFTLTAAIVGLKKLGEAMFDCYTEFGEAERRFNQMSIALGGSASSIQKASDLIDRMARISLSSKDDIESLVSELASLGKSDSQIEAITTAAVNLSNVTGKDLNSAFTLINATYAGTTGKLTQLLPELSKLTKEQLASGEATRIINEKFGELSNKLSDNDIPQKLKNLKDGFGDLRENIGELTAGVFSGFTSQLQDFIDNLNNAFGQYKAFLKAKSALTAEDKALALAEQKKYIEEELKNTKALLDKEYARIKESARINNPGVRSLQPAIDKIIENDAAYNYVKGALSAVQARLDSVNKQLNALGITNTDYKTIFSANSTQSGNRITTSAKVTSRVDYQSGVSGMIPPDESSAYDAVGAAYRAALADPVKTMIAGLMDGIGNDLRVDLESYGWTGLGDNIFMSMAKAIDGEARTDLESYGWNTDILSKPMSYAAITRNPPPNDDLENYGWTGLGTSLFDEFFSGWSKAQANLKPEESGNLTEMLYKNMFFDPVKSQVVQWAESIGSDTRDDLENYGWEGLGSRIGDDFINGWINSQSAYNPDESGPQVGGQGYAGLAQLSGIDKLFNSIKLFVGGDTSAFGAQFAPIMNALGPIVESLGVFGQMIGAVNPWLMLLVPVAQGLASILGPAISDLLQPLVGQLVILGSTLGQMILPVLQLLAPVIKIISDAFIWLYNNAIMPFANVIIEIGNVLYNSLADMLNFFLGWLGVNIPNIDINSGKLQAISSTDLAVAGASSTSTASQSASYRTQSITINIYQQAPVVGSGGMTEFARMIRGEFLALDYYGA